MRRFGSGSLCEKSSGGGLSTFAIVAIVVISGCIVGIVSFEIYSYEDEERKNMPNRDKYKNLKKVY